MSINIIDTLKPLGSFPTVDASDVQAGNERLSTVLSEIESNKVDKIDGKGLSTNDYTTLDKTKLSGIEANANNYTHPTTSGYKHIPSGGSEGKILGWDSDGTAKWVDDHNTEYNDATTSTHGLMSAADKTKINGIEANANNYVHPTSSGNKHVPSGGGIGQVLGWSADGTAVWDKKIAVTPEDYGAVGDGIADDTTAIQNAINNNSYVVFASSAYKITDTIVIPSNRKIDFGSGNITADCGDKPIFRLGSSEGAVENISISAAGAIINGTASAAFYLEGTTNFEHSPTNYTKCIRVDGVHVSSANITASMIFKTAVRQLYISNCLFYSLNGIIADGKIVETMFDKCIIYCTSDVDTYSVKITSDLASSRYSEGWTISDCTIDRGEIFISDIFVFELNNNYIGSTMTVQKPKTTTHTEEILITGNIFNTHGLKFNVPSSAHSFNAVVNGNVFVFCNISFSVGVYNVTISDNGFYGGSSWAVLIRNNCNYIRCSNLIVSESYDGGVIVQGAAGSGICISDVIYKGTGDGVYSERPAYLASIIPPKTLMTKSVAIKSQTYAANAAISDEITMHFAKGERGFITGCISINSTDSTRVMFQIPSGIDVPHGISWSSKYVEIHEGTITFNIPYTCETDISNGVIKLMNDDNGSITVGYHSWIAVVRNN